jgi:hypothetical protein
MHIYTTNYINAIPNKMKRTTKNGTATKILVGRIVLKKTTIF